MPETIGIDQYGSVYRRLGDHPRKALCDNFYTSHASKMYRDQRDGPPVHVGYVIRGHWITLFHEQAKAV